MNLASQPTLGRLLTALLSGEDRSADRYQQRSDPVYQKTYAVQRKLFGDRTRLQKAGLLTDLLRERPRAALLILGIEGDVLSRALAAFHRDGGDCSRITVILIDPLAAEVERERECLRNVPFAPGAVLAFAKPAEQLDETDWTRIRATGEDFVVYALLSLHFVPPEQRDGLLRRLHGLGRVTLALLEHDLNLLHIRSRDDRVAAVWNHFRPQFDLVDGLSCTAEERQVLLARLTLMVRDCFNDARDLLCLSYTESHERWSARLQAAGFQHDPTPRAGDPARLPRDGVTVHSWEDQWPGLEKPDRFYLIAQASSGA